MTNEVTKTEEQQPAQTEVTLRPAVDVHEDQQGITIDADLPGVSKDRLTIQVDRDTLTIEGELAIDMPAGMEPFRADVRSARYQRSFTLSKELDPEKIDAALTHGVLTLRIPKREEVRPRQIEVKVA